MIPTQAVEKAIEGGWKYRYGYDTGVQGATEAGWQEVALDPTFWQALGKALGWPDRMIIVQESGQVGDHLLFERLDYSHYWLHDAQRFHYLILTGGDTEAYWKELLKV